MGFALYAWRISKYLEERYNRRFGSRKFDIYYSGRISSRFKRIIQRKR